MATDVKELQALLTVLKSAAKPFLVLGQIADTVEPLLAVVNHQAELKASVTDLQSQKAQLASEIAADKAAYEKAKAKRRAEDDAWEAEHLKKHEGIRADVANAEADAKERIAKASAKAALAESQSATRVAAVEAEVNRKADSARADYEAGLKTLVADQDKVIQQTSQLQAHLDTLKTKLSPLLA
jgi:peptidoglycan hydrolase CwlO-like protein